MLLVSALLTQDAATLGGPHGGGGEV